jgi:hypothetical protein
MVISGARLTLTGTLETVRSAAISIPTAITLLLALVPILFPSAFFRSGQQPKTSVQGRLFRLIVGVLVVVLPLLLFYFLVRENVSGSAPSYATAGQTPPPGLKGDPQHPYIARMAYCPSGHYVRRGYLIENDQAFRLTVAGTGLAVFLVLGLLVNLNKTSIHRFYRDRLYEAYLADRPREERRDDWKVKDLRGTCKGFPYHIIATTLNEVRIRDEWEDTQHNFILAPRYCGSTRTGYRRTESYLDGINLADAVAISGAAISPIQARSFVAASLMVLMNVRLGQWYPHPLQGDSRRCHPTLPGLLWEHLSHPPDRRRYCFLTDGAHYDNLGLELLLTRRCRLIIVSDVSHDPKYELTQFFTDLQQAQARHGISFEPLAASDPGRGPANGHARIDVDPFTRRKQSFLEKLGPRLNRENFLVWKIYYPAEPEGGWEKMDGLLVLVKPSLTERNKTKHHLLHHLRINTVFPHDPDLEQIYDEGRVEAYRELGQIIGETLIARLESCHPGCVLEDPENFRLITQALREQAAESRRRKATERRRAAKATFATEGPPMAVPAGRDS